MDEEPTVKSAGCRWRCRAGDWDVGFRNECIAEVDRKHGEERLESEKGTGHVIKRNCQDRGFARDPSPHDISTSYLFNEACCFSNGKGAILHVL